MKIVSNKPTITRKDLEGVLDCLINEELTNGDIVKTFESHLAQLTENRYALAVNSLTSAYFLIYKFLNIDENSEVIIPSFSNQAPLSALTLTKGIPVLVDNDENSFVPSIEQIKEAITEKTKAIVISHNFGFHFDIEKFSDINIPIIEDISHAIGTEYNDQTVGSQATFAVASFSPEMIITTGNGGLVATNNSKSYSFMRDLRGSKDNIINLDLTMTDLQGAMGISQLLKLKNLLKRRKDIAKIYYEALRISHHKSIYNFNDDFAYQTFPVIFDVPDDRIKKYWKKTGIEILKAIEYPLHILTKKRGLDFPNCDRMSKKLYSLPLYPTLTKKEIEKISKTLSSFI